jgi:hypothetical protein
MFDSQLAINHIAIAMPSREAWLKQLAFLQSQGVTFHRRVDGAGDRRAVCLSSNASSNTPTDRPRR